MSTIRKKTWRELVSAISSTFRKWGVTKWAITPQAAPDRRDRWHSPTQRLVRVEFTLYRNQIVLLEGKWSTAHENLELMASALESMRLAEVRGTNMLVANAYAQIYPPASARPSEPQVDKDDPYVILGVTRSYPLTVIEAIWKQHLRVAHPDAGGSHDATVRINTAMDKIRKEKAA